MVNYRPDETLEGRAQRLAAETEIGAAGMLGNLLAMAARRSQTWRKQIRAVESPLFESLASNSGNQNLLPLFPLLVEIFDF